MAQTLLSVRPRAKVAGTDRSVRATPPNDVNYFIAAVFALFGENAHWVYLVQAALFGVSAAALLLFFSPRVGRRASTLLALFLLVVAAADGFPHYARVLLSENLAFALVPAMLILVVRAGETGSARVAAAAGMAAGIGFLVRPNMILAAPLFALLLARRPTGRWRSAVAFLALWIAVACLLPLRNALVTGSPAITVVTSTKDWMRPRLAERTSAAATAAAFASQLGRHSAFVLGFNPVVNPAFRPRPHWTLFWIGIFWLAAIRMRQRRIEWWELVLGGFALVYLVPIIAISSIGNYGFRMVLPLLGVVAVLAARGWSIALGWDSDCGGR